MKIYTKTGDQGQTSLIGGTRVPKYHPRIEAYGTVDELNSFVGLVRDFSTGDPSEAILVRIQECLFTLGSCIAVEPDKSKHMYDCGKLHKIQPEDVVFLEKEIDHMNDSLPELRYFVLPGGHPLVSYCHIARTVCRRAERAVLFLAQDQETEPVLIQYLNRLSDYFFVLSRYFTQKMNVKEMIWKP